MWGNKTGWIIASVVAMAMGLGVFLLQSAIAPSEMTAKAAKDPKFLAPIELKPGPETVVAMTDPGDAAAAYQAAIDAYEANPALYDHFDSAKIDQMDAVEKLLDATHLKDMHLFEKNPSKVVNYNNTKDPIEALRKVGATANVKASFLKMKNKPDEAKKYAEAAFALGAKLFNERIIYEECEAGLGTMGAAADLLYKIADEQKDSEYKGRIDAFRAARMALLATNGRFFDQHAITKTIDGDISARCAGDVFALASKSSERLWRVEACLQLARTKRNVGDNGRGVDQRYAKILMDQLSSDPDPIVRAAAIKARDITDDEYFKQS